MSRWSRTRTAFWALIGVVVTAQLSFERARSAWGSDVLMFVWYAGGLAALGAVTITIIVETIERWRQP